MYATPTGFIAVTQRMAVNTFITSLTDLMLQMCVHRQCLQEHPRLDQSLECFAARAKKAALTGSDSTQ